MSKFLTDISSLDEDLLYFAFLNGTDGALEALVSKETQKSVSLKYSEDQPRDENGRFAETDGGAGSAANGVKLDYANVTDLIWRPAMLRLDTLNRKYGAFTTYAETATPTNSSAAQDMKATVAEDLATRMSDLDPQRIVYAAGLDDPDIYLALQPAEENVSDYEDNEDQGDFQLVSINNVGQVVCESASDVIDLSSMSAVGWSKQDVLEGMKEVNDQPAGEPPNYALQGTPEAEDMVRQAGVTAMVSQWAQTSNDSSPISLAIQETAAKEFGIENHADWNTELVKGQVQDKIEKFGDVYSAFLHAQYDNTQEFLKQQNISSVTVYRGMKELSEEQMAEIKTNSKQDVAFRPLTSWSLDEAAAFKFAGEAYQGVVLENAAMFRADIPVENILSIPVTGVGCLHESEVVAFGGQHSVEVVPVKTWYENAIVSDKDGWAK